MKIVICIYFLAASGSIYLVHQAFKPDPKKLEIKKVAVKKVEPLTHKKPLVVAVIDTGISEQLFNANFVCKEGSKDFTGTGLKDNHGHGTHISGLIDQYAKDIILQPEWGPDGKKYKHYWPELLATKADYCQIIIKFYDPGKRGIDNLHNEIEAIKYATSLKVDIINFSGGGLDKSKKEIAAIKEALDAGIKVVVAAGNEHSNIDDPKKAQYYPANIDPRLYVVGNLSDETHRAETSNWGNTVNCWELGENRMSLLPNNQIGLMTGTSQATAIKTGKIVHEMLNP